MSVALEIQGLQPSAQVILYELDLTPFGDTIYRFHDGVTTSQNDVVWQGNTYARWPLNASGFDYSGNGAAPQPKLQVSNFNGVITALCKVYDDMVGAKLTRKVTFARFLDAVNFPGGNVTADPNAHLPDETWYVFRKAAEGAVMVEFDLCSPFDLAGVMLPARQVIQNVCTFVYRTWDVASGQFDYSKVTCPYNGAGYFDRLDQPVASASQDRCGHRLASCRKRYPNQAVPFGGFPGAGVTRS